MKRIVLFALIVVSSLLSCKNESSTNNEDKYLNFYVLGSSSTRVPSGFYLTKMEDGSFYGKSFSVTQKIKDIVLISASKDTLKFVISDGRREDSYIITSLNLNDKTAKLHRNGSKYGNDLEFGTNAEQTVIDFSEELYFEVTGKEKTSIKKNNSLPSYSKVRAILINSKDPNEAESLLGKADEVWQKRLLTYSLFYKAAKINGKKVHVRVVYDHRDNIVDEVTYHELGSKIQVGRFNFVQSPF